MSDFSSDTQSASGDYDRLFWGAAHVLALGTLERLSYNSWRYESESETRTSRDTLLLRTDEVMLSVMAYRNVNANCAENPTPALVSAGLLLQQRINNQLYTLHHDLLERDPDELPEIISRLDVQLRLWQDNQVEDEQSDALYPLPEEAEESLRNLNNVRELIEGLSRD